MSYKIVHNRKEIEMFENLFYSKSYEKYERIFLMYMSPNIDCIKRSIIRYNDNLLSHKRLYKDIKHYEVPLGTYTQQNHTTTVPQETLALYTSINPRNAVLATHDLTKDILEKAFSQDKNFSSIDQNFKNKLQKHPRTLYISVDLDTKDEKIYQSVIKDLTTFVNIYAVIENKTGYHIIIHKKDYNKINALKFIHTLKEKYKHINRVSNDLFSPIPGTIQEGFQVRFRDC